MTSVDADLVVVRSFLSRFDAEMAKSALDAAGIDSLVRADDAGGMQVAMSMGHAVELLVRADEAERAGEILDSETTTITESTSDI